MLKKGKNEQAGHYVDSQKEHTKRVRTTSDGRGALDTDVTSK